MAVIIGVRFKNTGKVYYFDPGQNQLEKGSLVVVETARGIEMIKNADPNRAFLTLKSLETYGQMADGKATKIIVPSQLQDVASMLSAAKEFLRDPES